MTTSIGGRLTVTGADGLLCLLVGNHGPLVRYGLVWGNDGNTFDDDGGVAGAIARIWPLVVGHYVTWVKPNGGGKHSQLSRTWSVTDHKRIQTAAGSFDAFEVIYEARNLGYMGGLYERRVAVDISTEFGYIVKSTTVLEVKSSSAGGDWELTSVVKPAAKP